MPRRREGQVNPHRRRWRKTAETISKPGRRPKAVTDFAECSMSFAGQTAIVTGASSGIGWAVAKALAAEGCRVGLIARRQANLESLTGEIHQDGGRAAWAVADVADRQQTLAAIAWLRQQLGPV